ncbi:cobalamin-binding protein [Sediminihaliea albiluteola]|uniref:cobalamin-binding protein n=1 Tax=Sediminihaliea albiluteola TaxID=2758564 RepID=UPI002E2C8D02|nr:cobalamin-binding protein [Sediminihaliea albiluteola]
MKILKRFIPFLALLTCYHCNALATAIEVSDSTGRKVQLKQAAERIVALSPHSVENVFSAGAGAKLVGAVSYSDYPEAARNVPRVGSYQSWSIESIIAQQPDLVLMWGSGNSLESLPALERLGITVYISELRTLQDIPRTLRAIGTLADTVEASERSAQEFEQTLASLKSTYRRQHQLKVFYQVWNSPLQTLSGEHMISDVIALCGGQNLFFDAAQLAPRVSLESVLERNPDVIVASGMDAARPEWLDEWRAYPSIEAVKNEALFFIHPDLLQRPTMRLLQGAQQLCEQLATLAQ